MFDVWTHTACGCWQTKSHLSKLLWPKNWKQRIHMHTSAPNLPQLLQRWLPLSPKFLSSSLAFHSICKGDYQKLPWTSSICVHFKLTNWHSTWESHHHSEKSLLLTLNSQPLELDTPKKPTALQHTIMTLHLILLGFNIRINTRKLVFITRISFHFNVVQQDSSLGFYHQV